MGFGNFWPDNFEDHEILGQSELCIKKTIGKL